ncbi:unnamed protein product [Choristocarpus tenellus]
MLHSYVFDTEFHTFLREILCATVSVCTGGGGAPAMNQLQHPVNEWGQTPAEQELITRVLKMGATQLLDVILHSRERRDVKAWQALLSLALSSSDEICR